MYDVKETPSAATAPVRISSGLGSEGGVCERLLYSWGIYVSICSKRHHILLKKMPLWNCRGPLWWWVVFEMISNAKARWGLDV